MHLGEDAREVGGELGALGVGGAVDDSFEARAGDAGHDEPVVRVDAKSVDEEGGGDGRGFALKDAEGVDLVICGPGAALGVEAEGELLHDVRDIVAVL